MTDFATGVAQRDGEMSVVLLVEGLPYGFGSFSATSAYFSGFTGGTFEGVKPWLRASVDDRGEFLPVISGSRADIPRGKTSVAVVRLPIVDYDGTLAAYMGTRRTDGWLRIDDGAATTISGGASTTAVLKVVDASIAVPGYFVTVSGETRRVASIDTTASPETITLASALGGAPSNGTTVLASELAGSSGATTCTVVPSPSSSSGAVADWPTADGTLWAGVECCTFTRSGSTLTLTRGKYRSRVQQHRGSLSFAEKPRDGAILTQYPRGLVGRRCWLLVGYDATLASECREVLAGQIAVAEWDGTHTLVVECEDSLAWLRAPAFTNIGRKLYKNGVPPTGRIGIQRSVPGGPTISFSNFIELDPQTTNLMEEAEDGEQFELLFGNVLFIAEYDASGSASLGVPALKILFHFGGQYESGQAGEFRSCVSIGRVQANNAAHAGFAGGDDPPPDHPLFRFLQILLSTGSGTNTSGSARYNYDCLPPGAGLGIPIESVDVSAIEELADLTAGYEFVARVTAVVDDAREFFARMLLPYGFIVSPGIDKAITVRRLAALGPDAVSGAATITNADLVVDKDGRPVTLKGPKFEDTLVAGAIKWSERRGYYDGTKPDGGFSIGVASEETEGLFVDARPIEVDAFGLTRESGLFVRASPDSLEFDDLLSNFVHIIHTRYALPPSILTVAVRMSAGIDLLPGDFVSVTLPNIPNARSATRGLTAEVFEVVAKTIDFKRNLCELELSQSAHGTARTRYVAPACDITAWNGGTKVLTVAEHSFSATGDNDDSDAFIDGDRVVVASADLKDKSSVTYITARAATTITLNDAVTVDGGAPASGMVLIHAPYTATNQPTATKAKYAFRAGSDGYLSTSDQPATYAAG
jgi:hypothetical protein